jgi:hypothetical protein
MLWLGAALGFFNITVYGIFGRFILGGISLSISLAWAFNLVIMAITGALFALVASRFFVEARRTGELELLLTTPLGAQEIVAAQWDILIKSLRFPVLVMLLPLGFQMLSFSSGAPGSWKLYFKLSVFLSGANTIIGTLALCWTALWFALRIDGQGRVILWTVVIVKGVPYSLSIICWLLSYYLFRPVFLGNWPGISWLIGSIIPSMIMLFSFLWLISAARAQLRKELLTAEPLNPIEMLSQALRRLIESVRRARQW